MEGWDRNDDQVIDGFVIDGISMYLIICVIIGVIIDIYFKRIFFYYIKIIFGFVKILYEMVLNVLFLDYFIGGWVNFQDIVGLEFIVGQ